MKKILFTAVILVAYGCGGSISDEQRKKFREGMEDQKIMKVSDSEIVSGALQQGQSVYEALEKIDFNLSRIDSLASEYNVDIRWTVPGDGNARDIENQLIEAYVLGMETGALPDNVQKIHKSPDGKDYDSLLYSKPVVTKLPDGTDVLEGVWNIRLSRKQVILALGKKKGY